MGAWCRVANSPQDLPMRSLWRNRKMFEEPGAPWKGAASTGPTPQCTCAGTGTQVCPEQTTAQLLRYGCHERTREPFCKFRAHCLLKLSLEGDFTPNVTWCLVRAVMAETAVVEFAGRPTCCPRAVPSLSHFPSWAHAHPLPKD